MFSAREVLDIAIRLEKNGETVYRAAIKKLSDPNLSLLLEWMADEEAQHARCFSRMQQKLTLEPPDPIAEEMGQRSARTISWPARAFHWKTSTSAESTISTQ